MNPRDPAGVPQKGAFRVPRPQMGARRRGYLPNWSAEVYRDAEVRGSMVTGRDASGEWNTVPLATA